MNGVRATVILVLVATALVASLATHLAISHHDGVLAILPVAPAAALVWVALVAVQSIRSGRM